MPAPMPTDARRARLDALRTAFDGLDTRYPLADGRTARRIYLDSAASNLRLRPADAVARQALAHYANTHSQLHFGARIMTALYDRAHDVVRNFVGAGDDYTAIFVGNGVTGGLNRMARVLAAQRPERDTVITTIMEHHANDLPHRKHVGRVVHVPVELGRAAAAGDGAPPAGHAGRVDLAALRRAIEENADRLNYVAVTAASNVTGVVNPVHAIARMAHAAGALVVVDAAQSAAHVPLAIEGAAPEERLDVVCLSGHKIYAPGSPGVVVARKALFDGVEPADVGGGIVDFVDTARYHVTDHLPEREETGTPNLPGSLTLAAALLALQRVGMDVVEADEHALTAYALERFTALDGLRLYGPRAPDEADRIGVLTFNLDGLPHGLVTAALNDYFGIAVRNECFCAQPFVRQLLGIADAQGVAPDACLDRCSPREQPGMVRVSLGLYNTRADLDACADALADLAARPGFYRAQYAPVPGSRGDWRHRTFRFDPADAFCLDEAVDAALAEAMPAATSPEATG